MAEESLPSVVSCGIEAVNNWNARLAALRRLFNCGLVLFGVSLVAHLMCHAGRWPVPEIAWLATHVAIFLYLLAVKLISVGFRWGLVDSFNDLEVSASETKAQSVLNTLRPTAQEIQKQLHRDYCVVAALVSGFCCWVGALWIGPAIPQIIMQVAGVLLFGLCALWMHFFDS